MADIRIKDLATTASTTASDDFMAVDGTTNGTRKLSAATPSFATSVTVPGVSAPAATNLTLAGGTAGTSSVVVSNTTAASTTTSGALRVGSNVGLSGNAGGASYFGGTVNITSTTAQAGLSVGNSAANLPTIYLRQNDSATGDFTLQNKNATSGYVSLSAGGGVDGLRIYPTTGNAAVVSTTSASSSTTGALTIGNGTAATNVAIGGGNVNAGGTLTTGGAATFAGAVAIGNTVSSVSPTSPNRTITIVVGGVTLYISAKTTND